MLRGNRYTRLDFQIASTRASSIIFKGLHMTDEEKQMIDQFGITNETKTIFYFRGHKYERLSDALNYAKKEVDANLQTQECELKN